MAHLEQDVLPLDPALLAEALAEAGQGRDGLRLGGDPADARRLFEGSAVPVPGTASSMTQPRSVRRLGA